MNWAITKRTTKMNRVNYKMNLRVTLRVNHQATRSERVTKQVQAAKSKARRELLRPN